MSRSNESTDADVIKVRGQIEQTRAEMSVTLRALEEKLNTDELRKLVKDEVLEAKAAVNDVIVTARAGVRADVLAVKDELKRDATDAVGAVRSAVKQDLGEAMEVARAATIGKVEILATKAGHAMTTTRDSIVDTVRQNPVPVALVGVGLLWMFMNRKAPSNGREIGVHQPAPGAGALGRAVDTVAHAAVDAEHKVAGLVHDAGDALGHAGAAVGGKLSEAAHATSELAASAAHGAGEMLHDAGESVTSLARQVPLQAHRLEARAQATFFDNPLAVGAVVLGAGALLGLALPHSRVEDSLMGDARQRLLHRAEGAASEAVDAVRGLGEQAATAARDAIAHSAV